MSQYMPRRQPVAHNEPAPGGASIRYANGRVKRAFDLAAGVALSIVTAPIIALLAVGSAVSFRAWPLFVQQRLGRGGRPFCFVKLRSLPTDTPADADKYTIAGATTRWGGFLRASHLDELPQCWLVVTGRMSLVGPRPEMPALAATFDATFMRERLAVRPGITGPWQVSTASSGLIGEAPEFDRLYLAHAGPRLDAWVLLRTTGMPVGLRPLPLERFPGWACNGSAPAGAPMPDVNAAAQTADSRRQTGSSS
jgi:lipopolysaccharide/colanic/teichoic acid biosynthesis glycosyltransferase